MNDQAEPVGGLSPRPPGRTRQRNQRLRVARRKRELAELCSQLGRQLYLSLDTMADETLAELAAAGVAVTIDRERLNAWLRATARAGQG